MNQPHDPMKDFFIPTRSGSVSIYYVKAMLQDPDIYKLYQELTGHHPHPKAALALFPNGDMETR